MRNHPRRTTRALGVLLVVGLLSLTGCKSGGRTAGEFRDYVKDHPVPGTRIDSVVGHESVLGNDNVDVAATLTAKATDSSVTRSMTGLCAFKTNVRMQYTLAFDNVSTRVACLAANRRSILKLWHAAEETGQVQQLVIDVSSVSVTTTGVDPALDLALALPGLVRDSGFGGKDGVTLGIRAEGIDVGGNSEGHDLTQEVGLTRRYLEASGPVGALSLRTGAVQVTTTAPLRQAVAWGDAARPPSGVDLGLHSGDFDLDSSAPGPGRTLALTLFGTPGVTRGSTFGDELTVVTDSLATARPLPGLVRKDPGASSFATLELDTTAGTASCEVVRPLPALTDVETLLDVCGAAGVVRLIDLGDGLRLTHDESDLAPLVQALKRLPAGTTVNLGVAGAFVYLRTGDRPDFIGEEDDKQLTTQITSLWGAGAA